MKVWVVGNGYYSDYENLAVFSSEGEAENFCEMLNAGSFDSFELDSFANKFPKGKKLYHVTIDKSGDNASAYIIEPTLDERPLGLRPFYLATCEFFPENDNMRRIECWAKDENHAIKIANDARVQAIASGEWK